MATGQAIALIASAIGSAIQGKGAKKAAAANIAGQKEAAAYAMEGSMPWDVSGSLGGAKFDSEGKAISLSLSPEFKTQQEAKNFQKEAKAKNIKTLIKDLTQFK